LRCDQWGESDETIDAAAGNARRCEHELAGRVTKRLVGQSVGCARSKRRKRLATGGSREYVVHAAQERPAIKRLVRQHYFDGLNVVRAQDNYVVQWGDEENKRSLGGVPPTAPPEFLRSLQGSASFRPLQDADVYAAQVGFIDSWPVGRDPAKGQEWLTHCYGMLGVGRDTKPDSGSGAELYVVIGHSPRHLDRNVALVGRVLSGIELLSTLPRGTADLGFYAKPEQYMPIQSITVTSDLPVNQRVAFEVLRSDTPLFSDYLNAQRSRHADWFVEPTDRLEICNAKVPVRIRH
jgi:peptidylprolyl isomerase